MVFRFPLRHRSFLIKLTLLQLHHRTSLIKLTDIASSHFNFCTCSFIKLTNITSLHYHGYMCSILTLHHSNLISHYSVTIPLQIPSDIHLLHLPSNFVSLAQRCAPYSISNYIRNTSKLLLLSGDIEINPGPRPIDQNSVFCSICSKKINRGPQQDMTPTCTVENCNARCHQACNGLSIGQICHAKDSGRSITWKCHQHGSGVAEIVVPPTPVYERPNRPSASGKSCSVCKNPIRTQYADLAYHCADPFCENVCHLAATCSGFVNPRGTARALHQSLELPPPLFTISNFASITVT